MKSWGVAVGLVGFGVLIGLLAAGLILLTSTPPRGNMISLLPPPSPLPLSVHVTGAVAHPGVYSLSPSSRVQDAIQAAGGLLPEANDQGLNLAAPLQDGELIRVPLKPQPAQDESSTTTSPTGQSTPKSNVSYPTPESLININTATLEELDTLPGIGPALAERIIAYREANGPFGRIEDIQEVSGIGPVKFENVKDLITVWDIP